MRKYFLITVLILFLTFLQINFVSATTGVVVNTASSSSNLTVPKYSYTLPKYTVPKYNIPKYKKYNIPTYNIPSYDYMIPQYTIDSFDYKKIEGGYMTYGAVFCYSGYYKSGNSCQKIPVNGYSMGNGFNCFFGYTKVSNTCINQTTNTSTVTMATSTLNHATNSNSVSTSTAPFKFNNLTKFFFGRNY